MTWLSFDDDYTQQAVWDRLPYEARWHYHAFVEKCCATRRYTGRLRWRDALRCSDVPDPDRSLRELTAAGLLRDLGDELEAVYIDDFLPPAGQRPEQLAPRKRRNQAEYRARKCQRGEHDRHCPSTCPKRQANGGSPATQPVGQPVTPGRVGSGRAVPETEGQGISDDRHFDGLNVRRAGDEVDGEKTPPSQTRKTAEFTTARDPAVPGDQQIRNGVPDRAQPQAVTRGRAEIPEPGTRQRCPQCGADDVLVMGNGLLRPHGSRGTTGRGRFACTGVAPAGPIELEARQAVSAGRKCGLCLCDPATPNGALMLERCRQPACPLAAAVAAS